MEVRPIDRDRANAAIRDHHSHHKKVRSHRYALAACEGEELLGVVIVGNPLAQALNDGRTFEVTRLCTWGHKNAASFLLGASWRVAKAMGVRRMVSYIRSDEAGTCYRAAGWRPVAETKARNWQEERHLTLPGILEPASEPSPRVRFEVEI